MTVKWVAKYIREPKPVTTGAVIDNVIDTAPDYHAGELESIRGRLDKLQEIMVTLVDLLPESMQRDLAAKYGYNYEELK